MEKKINAVNVLDFTTLNHRSSIPLLTIYKTTCDSSRRLTKYDVDNDGMGRWAHKESEYLGMHHRSSSSLSVFRRTYYFPVP